MRRLESRDASFDSELATLLAWDAQEDDVSAAAQAIIADVRARGDVALMELTRRFDGIAVDSAQDLALDTGVLAEHFESIAATDREALMQAAQRIRAYHEHQLGGDFTHDDGLGNRLGMRITPLERVGVYVPGGQAAYPSTVLMTVIPARVAGVDEVIVTVPTPGGERDPHVLAALHVAGVDRVFTIGGAQAIAALAHGTDLVPRVDKIVGPGGVFVAAAKRLVFGPVGIDVIAGPSEICIIADGSVPARWTAMDVFSQAEHDAAAQSILISPSTDYLDAVQHEMNTLLPALSRADIIGKSLAARGAMIVAADLDEACTLANRIAPEHLQLAVREPRSLLPKIRHAGAIFLGGYSAEVLGDYSAGPSHVLPTYGTARHASPLGVYDFQKRSSIIDVSQGGAPSIARIAATIADQEGLSAHAASARYRAGGYDDNVT